MDNWTEKEKARLIRNVSRYMEKDAKDIMTHRKNIVAVDGQLCLEDALKFMLQESYSRFPVYVEDIDGIVGFMHLREAITCYMDPGQRSVPVKELTGYIRSVNFIPETKNIDMLFREMQQEKSHIAIVIDEYGQTSGLVSLEDILEEIVGNILDEYDEEEEEITALPDGSFVAQGMLELEKLEDRIPVVFERDDYETLNGFLVASLDRIPGEEEHCTVEYKGYRFTILEVNDNTIQRVKIEKLEEAC